MTRETILGLEEFATKVTGLGLSGKMTFYVNYYVILSFSNFRTHIALICLFKVIQDFREQRFRIAEVDSFRILYQLFLL